VFHRHRHGGVVTLDHHAERVADQHDVDVRVIEQHREARVITGEAGDLLAFGLHLPQGRDVHRRTRRAAQLQLGVHAEWRRMAVRRAAVKAESGRD
jgi:hypothetical protein